jgi:hypothetical protein
LFKFRLGSRIDDLRLGAKNEVLERNFDDKAKVSPNPKFNEVNRSPSMIGLKSGRSKSPRAQEELLKSTTTSIDPHRNKVSLKQFGVTEGITSYLKSSTEDRRVESDQNKISTSNEEIKRIKLALMRSEQMALATPTVAPGKYLSGCKVDASGSLATSKSFGWRFKRKCEIIGVEASLGIDWMGDLTMNMSGGMMDGIIFQVDTNQQN